MADKDLAEKYLESFSDVFADIYNVLLFRKEILLEEGLEEGPTESIYKVEENNLRNQFRDTVKLYKNGLYKVASFGIENESRIDKNMPIRIMGYDYAVYRVQIDREEERKYPAITIVLNFSDTEWKSPNALFDILDVSPELRPYVNDYKIFVFNIEMCIRDSYMSASQDGIVKDIVFRGNRLDVTVDVGGIEIICEWPLEKESLEIGEKVSLLIYRLYVLDKERTYLCENKEMQEDDVFYI